MVRVSAGSSINMIHHSSECSNTCGFLCPFGLFGDLQVFPPNDTFLPVFGNGGNLVKQIPLSDSGGGFLGDRKF